MTIYERFRDARGWTQAELANRLAVSRAAVHNYERGRVPDRRVAWRFLDLAREHGFAASVEDVFPPPADDAA